MTLRWPLAFLAALALCCPLWAGAPEAAADVWPQFRGPNRDGVSHAKGLAASWPEQGPRELWRTPIGEGFSAMVVDGDRLYTMFSEEGRELLGCFGFNDGRERWRRDLDKLFVDEFGDGPRAAPTVDGDLVYALSSNGTLAAVDKRSGAERWRVSFAERFGAKPPRWGFSGAPLIEGGMALVETGGGENEAFAAFDKLTGETLWTAYDGVGGYSSPIVIDWQGRRLAVALASQPGDHPNAPPKQQLIGLTMDGKLAWRRDTPGFLVAMPVFAPPDRVFVSASNDDGCRMFRLSGKDGDLALEELWANRSMRNHFNSSIFFEGHLYGFNNATLQCVDAADGERKWGKRGFGKGSLTLVEGKLILISDRGRVVLADASSEGYREISAFQALKGKCWTSPTVTAGKLLVRSQTEMACFDLAD